ncbi:MAG: DUF5989 family protein [Planctomycetaceae bacterium]
MSETESNPEQNQFEAEADQAEMGLIAEFWDFIKHNKKWWLTPIILIILLMAGVILLGPAAPFIYPLL